MIFTLTPEGQAAMQKDLQQAQAAKKKALKQKRARLTRRMKDELMADLGLTKVRGAVSGRVYYE